MTKFPTQYHNSHIHNQPLNHKSNKHKNPIQQTHKRMKEKEERKSLSKSNSQNPRANSQNRKTLEKQIKTLANTINESKHEAEAYLRQLNKDREKIRIQK